MSLYYQADDKKKLFSYFFFSYIPYPLYPSVNIESLATIITCWIDQIS